MIFPFSRSISYRAQMFPLPRYNRISNFGQKIRSGTIAPGTYLLEALTGLIGTEFDTRVCLYGCKMIPTFTVIYVTGELYRKSNTILSNFTTGNIFVQLFGGKIFTAVAFFCLWYLMFFEPKLDWIWYSCADVIKNHLRFLFTFLLFIKILFIMNTSENYVYDNIAALRIGEICTD